MASHDLHVHKILDKIESNTAVSQRSLARELGIALGLTNLLLRKIVRRGWIRLVRVRPNRVRYLITPAGLSEKARMYRDRLAYNLQFYRETRDRIHESFGKLSLSWHDAQGGNGNAREQRIVLYGVGEVAEIGFVCLQDTDLRLVGVVADGSKPTFFGLPVHCLDHLDGSNLGGVPFDRLVIMSFHDVDQIRQKLVTRGVPLDAVHVI